MNKILRARRAQSFLEYAMLIGVVSIALRAIFKYMQRSINVPLNQVQVELDESKR